MEKGKNSTVFLCMAVSGFPRKRTNFLNILFICLFERGWGESRDRDRRGGRGTSRFPNEFQAKQRAGSHDPEFMTKPESRLPA